MVFIDLRRQVASKLNLRFLELSQVLLTWVDRQQWKKKYFERSWKGFFFKIKGTFITPILYLVNFMERENQ